VIDLYSGQYKPAAAQDHATCGQLPVEAMGEKTPGEMQKKKVADCVGGFDQRVVRRSSL
jgi:hypothetical protein